MFDLFSDEPTFDPFSDEQVSPSSDIFTNFFQTPKVLEPQEVIQPIQTESDSTVEQEQEQTQDLDSVPNNLKQYITQEVWDSYSSARRESFMNMFKNPNSFFYRNRPPGDPQKMGGFTSDEEEQFIQRINYFRNDLKVYDKLWGLFAVPLKGRLGYQCMNFYRHLIEIGRLKKIKPKTDGSKRSKNTVSPEVQKKLEQEALDFIKQCLSLNKQITEPQTKFERQPKNISTSSDEYSDSYAAPHNNEYENHKSLKKHSKGNDSSSLNKFNRKKESSRNQLNSNKKGCISYIYYAPDPITNKPMENPLLDQYAGIVLDKSSWTKYFNHEIAKPYNNICAKKLSDLLPLTPQVFEEFRNQIVNVYI